MKIKKYVSALALLVAGSFQASAVLTPVNPIGGNGSEQSLQTVFNNNGLGYINVQSDAQQLDDSQDSYWTKAGNTSASLIIEIAGYKNNNSFGIFDAANPNNRQQIFAGAANAGASASFTPLYNVFGFYLQNTVNGNFTWFSDSSLNAGGQKDHMVAYGAGNSSYILAWEDLNLGDWDYQDMVVRVSNVKNVPDAGSTLVLLGAGMSVFGFLRRRK